MADTDDDVQEKTSALTPEETEHQKLFDEFAAKHRAGAATAAPGDEGTKTPDSADEKEPEDKAAAEAADKAATGESDEDKTQNDIWATATPAQKAAHDAALANLQAGEQYKRSNEGRIAGYQRQVEDLNKALAGRATATTTAKVTAADDKVDDASKSLNDLLNDPDFLAAEKEYPEIYKPLRKTMGGVLARAANLETEIGQLRTTTTNKFERDAIREESEKIKALDPDYIETVTKPEFQPAFDKWLSEQPVKIQELVSEAAAGGVKNASDTSWAFRKFKQDTGFGGGQAAATGKPAAKTSTSSATETTRRALQLDSSSNVRSTRPSATPNDKSGQGDSVDADWKRNVERIKKRQQAEGISY